MVDYVLVLRSSGTYINHCIRGKYYRNYLYQNLLNIDQSFKTTWEEIGANMFILL